MKYYLIILLFILLYSCEEPVENEEEFLTADVQLISYNIIDRAPNDDFYHIRIDYGITNTCESDIYKWTVVFFLHTDQNTSIRVDGYGNPFNRNTFDTLSPDESREMFFIRKFRKQNIEGVELIKTYLN